MEFNLATILSLLSIAFVILNYFNGRKDKSNDKTESTSYKQGQLDAQLKNIFEKLEKIDRKLETYDREIENRIEKAVEIHIKEYHGGGR